VRLDRVTRARAESHARPPAALAVGVDIGGTKLAAGVVSPDGEIIARQVTPTPAASSASIVEFICRAVTQFRERIGGIAAVGVGAAGWVQWPTGRIRYSPYIAFNDFPLQQSLRDTLGVPVTVDNDANTAAWAESRFGAGKGVANMLLLTLGTGIGGGLILGGELYRGTNSLGAEIGHIALDPGGDRCGCGNRGCFEAKASGTALGRAASKLVAARPDVPLARLGAPGEDLTGVAVTFAAKAGDPSARALLAEIGSWCGIGIASLVAVLDPGLIVITGGLAESGELLLKPLRASLQTHVFARDYREAPPVVVSPLGPDAGLIGAGALALHALHA
jgi:glucokinase